MLSNCHIRRAYLFIEQICYFTRAPFLLVLFTHNALSPSSPPPSSSHGIHSSTFFFRQTELKWEAMGGLWLDGGFAFYDTEKKEREWEKIIYSPNTY
jgi:hypothetical protein